MRLTPLFDFELRYTSLEDVDYGAGGQVYGTLEGTVSGEHLRGAIRLTNLAQRRADNVILPALRGLLETDDDSTIYVEFNGISTLREADQARVFVTSATFRTGDARYVLPSRRTRYAGEGAGSWDIACGPSGTAATRSSAANPTLILKMKDRAAN
jgi:hypothetical protein